MKIQAIIPTGGLGTRLKAKDPKPLLLLNQKPIFIYTLEVFEQSSLVHSVILVVHKDYLNDFEKVIRKYKLKKVTKIIAGGVTRSESVANGLRVVDEDTDIVVVHDGVRPFVSVPLIEYSIAACREHGAAVVAVPVKPTIKRANQDLFVAETLRRDELWEIQTPQTFKKDILLKAHQQGKNVPVTDDASLVEQLGYKVKIVAGDYRNIKITTPEDLVVAESFLKNGNG